jgi:P4 family phage/plasmid primase-like protien
MSQKRQSFDSYLNSHYSNKGEELTHTRIGSNELNIKGGKYTIKEEDEDEFYAKYIKHVFDNKKMEFLTEKQYTDAGPICLDFDFRYDVDIEEKQHTEDDIINMIDLYFDTFKELIVIPENTTVPVYVFEKEHVNALDNLTKDGIHMIIGIHMDRALQIILRDKIVRQIENVWSKLPLTNSWEEVVDDGIVKASVNWQLFGSRKPGHESYQLKYHYDLTLDEEGDWSCIEQDATKFNVKKNFKQLSARYRGHPNFEIQEHMKGEVEKIKNGRKKKSRLKVVQKKSASSIEEVTCKEELDEYVETFLSELEIRDYEMREIHNYTMCLGENYYNPYDKWIRVGWALKNTHEKLFITWMAFSAQSTKFSFDMIPELYEKWCGFEKLNVDGLTKRSIIYWVKNDNPTKYREIHEQTIDYYVERSIDHHTQASHNDLAKVLYQMYKDKIVCVSIKKDWWYVYNNHKWEENECGLFLRNQISEALFDIYHSKFEKYYKMVQEQTTLENQTNYDQLVKKSSNFCATAFSLKNRTTKDHIMREAKDIFYDTEFLNAIDANPRLLCFNNGVWDFQEKVFREGQPNDYLSKSTNIDYIRLDPVLHKKQINDINDFMTKLFPVEELRNYMWEHLASTLIGENNDQTFNIYNGCGSNGKSKLVQLMSLVLGDYKHTVPITLITQKRNSIGSTSSEVVQLKGIRYAVMQEPSKGDRINEGIMKEITGGDPLQGRALFKDSITFIPQFKLVACTNNLLDVNSNDEGTWRRICVCEFMSKFTSKIDPNDTTQPYQFPLDKTIDKKFKEWVPIFMGMLVDKALKTDGLVNICDIVKSKSNSYRNNQDYYSEFVNDKIKVCEGSKVKQTALYETFKNWYQLHHGKNVPKGRDLFEYINKKFGKKQRGGWQNITIVYDDDSDDEGMEDEDM